MWVGCTAWAQYGEGLGGGSPGAVMKRVERDQKMKPAIYRVLDFILIFFNLQFQIYILEILLVVYGELCYVVGTWLYIGLVNSIV